jgi:hypothetical protein
MFGKLGDMASMLQKAQKIQEDIKRIQAELAAMETIGMSSNGQVEALVGGDFTVKRIVIRESCLRDSPDPDVVGELVREAINNAVTEVRRNAHEKMREATGGLDLPGMG